LDRKIRIGAVSYLNTKPLIYGLPQHPIHKDIELVVDYPSHIASMLMNNQIDVGLVPVAIIPKLAEAHIITDYCIGCDGAVDSVAIFAEQSLEKIHTILLDYQSRTSVMLTRILMHEYWKQSVTWQDTNGEAYLHQIENDVAGVVIGDRALEQKKHSAYMYDLGAAWKAHTGLPFVFAAWVANKNLPASFIEPFSEANAIGLNNLEAVVAQESYHKEALMHYYTKNISYHLDDAKRKGLSLFLEKMALLNTTTGLPSSANNLS
jgi:chorismate dehydratase